NLRCVVADSSLKESEIHAPRPIQEEHYTDGYSAHPEPQKYQCAGPPATAQAPKSRADKQSQDSEVDAQATVHQGNKDFDQRENAAQDEQDRDNFGRGNRLGIIHDPSLAPKRTDPHGQTLKLGKPGVAAPVSFTRWLTTASSPTGARMLF